MKRQYFYVATAKKRHVVNSLGTPLMTCFLFIIVFCFYSGHCCAQNNATKERLRQQIAEVEAEIERLQSREMQSKSEKTYCFEKVFYQEIKPMTNEEFEQFCKKEIPNLANNKIEGNYTIISSCKQTPKGLQANFCIATTPNIVNNTPSVNNAAKEKELLKIRNTKKMYQDLIASLNKELQNNGIEIVCK